MGRPHPMALRLRVVGFVEEGHSHRSAAAQFRVSVKFVNDMVILKRETGALQSFFIRQATWHLALRRTMLAECAANSALRYAEGLG